MPAATKKPANGRAPKRAAAAAVAELTDTPRTGEFRGVAFDLPGKLPATFTLDLAEVQGARNDLGPAYRLLLSILGPDQWRMLRDKVAEDEAAGVTIDAENGDAGALGEMLGAVVGAYNMEPGESPASGTS